MSRLYAHADVNWLCDFFFRKIIFVLPVHFFTIIFVFTCSASVVRQLLLPLFQDWTHATMASLPSVSQVGNHQSTEALSCVPHDADSTIHPVPSPASPTCSPCAALWSLCSTSPMLRVSGAHVHCLTSHIPTAGTPDGGPPHGHGRLLLRPIST